MTSYDKVVKLACKPKAAPPKAKYLDPLIAATWSEDGTVHDVCKALSPRFREPNAIVVFKALIVLHTIIRNGATDNVLSYLSSSEVLRLQNVSAGNWEGYNAPQNLQHYAIYLDSRIRAYRDLKHDAIRVQAETNRDARVLKDIEEDGYRSGKKSGNSITKSSPAGHQRSKTVAGRKLRVMTVEKGLLRETKAVQRMIDSLTECRFYLDDLEDELTTSALRMLVKDLLILFQAGNEGVINVLEHYFEMSHVDARTALNIYRHFCKQTERVVEYLGVAKKLQNLLNVPIPNLKHAPVSLAGALQEYLDDPNFEQNRIEYKTNKESAEKALMSPSVPKAKKSESEPPPTPAIPISASTSSNTAPTKLETNQAMQDFFSAIEEEQPTMFNPQTGSPTGNYFQQQAATNPFQAQMASTSGTQSTGLPQLPQIQTQLTGFLVPQQTALQPQQQQRSPNPFGMSIQQQPTPLPNTFLQPQPTGLLQPQATGSNPFRQSMMFSQTSMSPFSTGSVGQAEQNQNPFSAQAQGQMGLQIFGQPRIGSSTFSVASPSVPTQSSIASTLPPRPASTPLTSANSELQPVKTHQTGTKNPFGVPMQLPPPVPKQPTLMELVLMGSTRDVGGGGDPTLNGTQGGGSDVHKMQQPFGGLNGVFSAPGPGSDMGNVASSFSSSSDNKAGAPASSPTSTAPSFLNSQSISTPSSGSAFSDASSWNKSTGTSEPSPQLRPQSTGFGGIKPFKPLSSFGASLLDSLPPIASATETPNGSSSPAQAPLSAPGTSSSFQSQLPNGLGPQPTGFKGQSSLGVGLRPQMTGGAANPFRASMAASSNVTGMGSSGLFISPTSTPSFVGGHAEQTRFGTALGQDPSQSQQQPQNASLI